MGWTDALTAIVRDFPLALYGSMLVGALCAFLGVYIVSKRIVFLGAVLTQVSVLGIAATFLPFFMVNHTLGSLGFAIVTVVIFSMILSGKTIPKDALLGVSFVTAIATRILIMQKTPKVEVSEIENLLRGDILFITPETFYGMLVVFAGVLVIYGLFFKEFSFIAFDGETARTQGFRTRWWELLFYLVTGVVISSATHMVGDIFVFGFLIIPPVTALLLMRKVRNIFILSILIGLLSPPVGLLLAFMYDFPASPAIVGVASCFLLAAWIAYLIRK